MLRPALLVSSHAIDVVPEWIRHRRVAPSTFCALPILVE